jgi:hypothetical protein
MISNVYDRIFVILSILYGTTVLVGVWRPFWWVYPEESWKLSYDGFLNELEEKNQSVSKIPRSARSFVLALAFIAFVFGGVFLGAYVRIRIMFEKKDRQG